MTLFEYVAIAYCLVISFAVSRAAAVLPHALAPGRRYWVHATWVFANLATSLLVFWNFWSYRNFEWTLGLFCLQLAVPTSVFVFSTVVAPDEPATVLSWRDYFYSVRVKLFASSAVFSVLIFLTSTLMLELPLLHPARISQGAAFGLSLVGAFSDSPRLHAALAALVIGGVALAGAQVFYDPGALGPSG